MSIFYLQIYQTNQPSVNNTELACSSIPKLLFQNMNLVLEFMMFHFSKLVKCLALLLVLQNEI